MILSLPPAVALALEPPAEYRYDPPQPYVIVPVTNKKLRKICEGSYEPTAVLLACTSVEYGVIFIDDSLGGEAYKQVRMHEWAHLNGWVHGKLYGPEFDVEEVRRKLKMSAAPAYVPSVLLLGEDAHDPYWQFVTADVPRSALE